jgi:predicted transcriptional regulator
MGITKSEAFTEEQNEIANLLKALANPARVAIIQYLLKVDSCICGDIVNELPLAQPTISQHLKELKNAKIIQGTIEGKSICYCINPETMSKIEHYFGGISQKLKNKCC